MKVQTVGIRAIIEHGSPLKVCHHYAHLMGSDTKNVTYNILIATFIKYTSLPDSLLEMKYGYSDSTNTW
jgi:hypothetical protein